MPGGRPLKCRRRIAVGVDDVHGLVRLEFIRSVRCFANGEPDEKEKGDGKKG